MSDDAEAGCSRDGKMNERKELNADCGGSDGAETTSISLDEYLETQSALEADAQAVLGAADLNNCTYDQGYMKRQALYSCATCLPPGADGGTVVGVVAGVCLACSLECHDGHELFELYTKRQFRCDCGNSKFDNSLRCKLRANKTTSNADNKYDQNFKGLYCTCHRPYPDPEHEEDGEMIQCCICEDWYHDNHLQLSAPVPDNYQEMVCFTCVEQHPFLLNYQEYQSPDTASTVVKLESSSKTDVGTETSEADTSNGGSHSVITGADSTTTHLIQPVQCDKLRLDCGQRPPRTLFLLEGWREQLCKCDCCHKYYQRYQIEYLLDVEESTHVYEQKSNAASADSDNVSYDKAVHVISSLDRVHQVELAHGYNDMKNHLAEYLRKFAQNGKVVKAEDIQEFFEDLKKNKRQRLMVPPAKCS